MTQLSRHLLTCINADKGSFGHVVQAANAPAFVLCFKELETHLQAVLHQPVGAHLRAALTPLVALVDPEKRQGSRTQITASEKIQIITYI